MVTPIDLTGGLGGNVYDFYLPCDFDMVSPPSSFPSSFPSYNYPLSPPITPCPILTHESQHFDNTITHDVLRAVRDLHTVVTEPHSPFYEWYTLGPSRPYVENLTGFGVIQTIYNGFMMVKYGNVTLEDICYNYEILPQYKYSSIFPVHPPVPPPGNNPPPVPPPENNPPLPLPPPPPGNIQTSQGIRLQDFINNCIDMHWSCVHDSTDMRIIPNKAHISEEVCAITPEAHPVSVIKHT